MRNTKILVAFAATFLAAACGSQGGSSVEPGGSSGAGAGTGTVSSVSTAGGSSMGPAGTGSGTGSGTGVAGSSTGASGGAAGASGGTGTGASASTATDTTAGTGTGTSSTTGTGADAGTGGTGSATSGGTGTATSTSTTTGTGSNPATPEPNRVRNVIPFDTGWLFNYGDATGASATAFADTAWRQLHVPHDWSIEGPNPPANPFSMGAATTGRGAYAPSGISWYRRHFTLPLTLSGDQVYIEFDGVMENSDVYINGTLLGHHPYGYVSFRYDMTASTKFGTTDNVVAVKTDTSLQPDSRYYAGGGIYRHVRVLVTNPVHVDQYATFVTTPAPTATSATVHVTTSVVNSGASAQMVSVQGMVSDPTGTALPPVTAAAQSIAAGASAIYTFDVPVANPELWDLTTPNMYELVTNVQVGGTTVDDDVTPFGIRSLVFNGGLTLNGQSIKLKGVANHQDFHGLGVAPPQRAVQRRLAQLKALGVNALRTAHNPPSPDLLDLTDRMGILVLDEFTDVWAAHKYTDVGDYAAYFTKTATSPTGLPAVPGIPTGATWGQTDLAGYIYRDRNHPSVALYSMGNEIHDSITARTPVLTKLVAISHAVDPSRDDTQALLDPGTAGDVGGATNMLLDVWGNNYNIANCLTALKSCPTKSGILTEEGTETSTWATVMANQGLTGEFIWTGVDYLGEAPGAWPTIGSTGALMDELGNVSPIGYTWQGVFGAPKTTPPATGTTASQVTLTADHAAIVADIDDASFVKAVIADAAGDVVTGSSTPVTFAITGPGTIVAVDSGSMVEETFRGNVRNAYQGIAYAIVQATGAGTITVTATAAGLTAGTATIQATAGTFVPCSGTCD
jgi:beta-galactosidase